jgi:hypothetical protein
MGAIVVLVISTAAVLFPASNGWAAFEIDAT